MYNAHAVILVNRASSSQVRYTPEDQDSIMVVPSSGGRYGKSSMIRLGSNVRRIKE